MKLYLSSYKFGDQSQQLANLIGPNKKIRIISVRDMNIKEKKIYEKA